MPRTNKHKTSRSGQKCPIAKTISGMDCGQRAWFIFARDATPRLVVQTLEADPDRSKITALQQDILNGTEPDASGILQRQSDGSFALVGLNLPATILEDLYAWVTAPDSRAPRCLLALTALTVDAEGQIQELPPLPDHPRDHMPVDVGLYRASKRLQNLKEDNAARVWVAAVGAAQRPMMVVQEVEDDPNGEAFQEALKRTRGRAQVLKGEVVGMIRRKGADLFFVTEASMKKAARALRTVADVPEAAILATVKIATVSGNDVTDVQDVDPSISEMANILENVQEGQHVYFVFSRRDNSRTHLQMATDKSTLTRPGEDRTFCRGRIFRRDNELVMQVRDGFPGAMRLLSRWFSGRAARYPIFKNLQEVI